MAALCAGGDREHDAVARPVSDFMKRDLYQEGGEAVFVKTVGERCMQELLGLQTRHKTGQVTLTVGAGSGTLKLQ
eukprot:7995830-Alexandrium_andersonii.AAC.1